MKLVKVAEHKVNIQNSYTSIIKQLNFFKWTKDFNRYFTKEDAEMKNKCMKRFSISLITKEVQTKSIIIRYIPHPI